MAGTTPTGNSPHKVIENIREFGVLPQEVLPWSEGIDSWPEFYSPDPMDPAMKALAQEILRKFDPRHKWLWERAPKERHGRLISGLEQGTVCVSVKAWRKKNGRYWKNAEEEDNHWVMLLDYKHGEYWLVYDHYDDCEKKLEWDYAFEQAKVYFLERRVNPAAWSPAGEPSLWKRFTRFISSLWT